MAWLVVGWTAAWPGRLPAGDVDQGPSPKARQWALLIGVDKYQKAPELRYANNDVRQLVQTLRTYGGYPMDRVRELTDAAKDNRDQPLKANIEAVLPDWLKQLGPEDTLLVYFSGHGFRDKSGKMYLAPVDCDPSNLADTGISIQWFRDQIKDCPANFKLLVLDACHAGSERGAGGKSRVGASELGESFRDVKGVVTLASSTANEKSQLWDDKQQSLFSYWLTQGLRGHADENNDGIVDVDELYKYTHRLVTQTAKARFPLVQTPVRIIPPDVADVQPVLSLKPVALKQVLGDVAEQLARRMEELKLEKVGVLEFTNDAQQGELLRADFGQLGRYCAEELEQRLVNCGSGKLSVVDHGQLQKVLAEQNFGVGDLRSPQALTRLSQRVGNVPVLAVGKLGNRVGREVNLHCRLLQSRGEQWVTALDAGGRALLNESEWAMLGRSVQVESTDRQPDATATGDVRPPTDTLIENLDAKAQGTHPMSDPSFPFPVRMLIGGKERTGVFRGNDLLVPVRQGEVYEIRVENRSGQTALLRLLVDGLNTLPEKEDTKGVQTYVVGKRVNLNDARHWELDPQDPDLPKGPVWAIRGFVTEVSVKGKLRKFVVVDAEQSLAAQRKFTDQIGIITAAFYAPAGEERGFGTKPADKETDEKIRKGSKLTPGNLIAVVHIRYVSAEALGDGRK